MRRERKRNAMEDEKVSGGGRRLVFLVLLLCLAGMMLFLLYSTVGWSLKVKLRLYPSQSYRDIPESEKILFYDREKIYKRGFMGLKTIYRDKALLQDGQIWRGTDEDTIYIWAPEQGIQSVDKGAAETRAVVSAADLEETGAVNERSGLIQARRFRDWEYGRGFTYWLEDKLYCYDYGTKSASLLWSDEGDGLGGVLDFDVSADKTLFAYRNREQELHIYHMDSGEDERIMTGADMRDIVFSPDNRYLLCTQMEYRSHITDDVTWHYNVLNLETKQITTVYQGYKEYLDYEW